MNLRPSAIGVGLLALWGLHGLASAQSSPTPEPIGEEVVTSGEPVEFVRTQCGGVKCGRPDSVRRAATAAELIFVGDVVIIRNVTVPVTLTPEAAAVWIGPATEEVAVVEFAVAEVIKGVAPATVDVRTRWLGVCGFALEPKQRYLVYAQRSDDHLWTDPFTRTKPNGLAVAEIRGLKRRFGVDE